MYTSTAAICTTTIVHLLFITATLGQTGGFTSTTARFTKSPVVEKNLMLLTKGGGYRFMDLWEMTDGLNDANGDKADSDDITWLVDGEDFRATIDPDWGSPDTLQIISMNDMEECLFSMDFDVAGLNISDLMDGVNSSSLYFMQPDAYQVKLTVLDVELEPDGDPLKELVLTNSGAGEVYFSVVHGASVTPLLVLAINSSTGFKTTDTVTDVTSDGCWPTWELSIGSSYYDTVNLTPQSCLTYCAPLLAAIKLGTFCACAEFLTQTNSLAHMCDKQCPGDTTYACGGTNGGYHSVYSGTLAQTSMLDDILVETSHNKLLQETHNGGDDYTINIQNFLGYDDEYLYIDGISVQAQNTSGHTILYSFSYMYAGAAGHVVYMQGGQVQYFVTDGTAIILPTTLLVKEVTIMYDSIVSDSVINLLGPDASSYVSLPYLLVRATFISTTMSTTQSTTSTSTPKTTATDSTTTTTTNDPTTTTTTNDPTTTTTTNATKTTTTTNAPTTTTTTNDPTTTTTTNDATTTTTTNAPSTADNAPTPTTTLSMSSCVSMGTTTAANRCIVHDNNTVSVNNILYCPCSNNAWNNSGDEPEYDFDEILAELTVDKTTVSANKRRYTSAQDDRPSAISMGSLGVVIIVFVLAGIVFMDSPRLIAEIMKFQKKYKRLKRQMSSSNSWNRVNQDRRHSVVTLDNNLHKTM